MIRLPFKGWRLAVALLVGVAGAAAMPVSATDASLAVSFVNASRPTRCAEEDNVYVKLLGTQITRFSVVVEHPPYVGGIITDSTAPDFSHCDMSQDPRYLFTPRTVVLHEDADIRLVGHRYGSFWRPDVVDFDVGGRVESGLHLVQLIRRLPGSEVEMLVVYPADGYWRAKPLPPPGLPDTAYGSSFLIGPVQESSRPYVAIRRIAFDPAALRFSLQFQDGRRGELAVAKATGERLELAVTLDAPVPGDQPFAALRSMYVAEAQSDVAIAAWPDATGGVSSLPIMRFEQVRAPSARFGRVQPSSHNLSAPDMIFERFGASPSIPSSSPSPPSGSRP